MHAIYGHIRYPLAVATCGSVPTFCVDGALYYEALFTYTAVASVIYNVIFCIQHGVEITSLSTSAYIAVCRGLHADCNAYIFRI